MNEEHSDDLAVDRFAEAMKAKLASSRAKGRGGWDDPFLCTDAYLASLLVEHLGKGNPGTFEDVANFAMMLHQRGADPLVLRGALIDHVDSVTSSAEDLSAEAPEDPSTNLRSLVEATLNAKSGAEFYDANRKLKKFLDTRSSKDLCAEGLSRRVEPIYLFRRKGLDDWVTCTYERYLELQEIPLFEVRVVHDEVFDILHASRVTRRLPDTNL